MSKQTTSKLAEGVSVTVTQTKSPPSIAFEIDNQLFVNLDFTLDIAGSKNLRCCAGRIPHTASSPCSLDHGKMEITTVVKAMSKKEVGVARAVEAGGAWSLAPKFRWTESECELCLLLRVLTRL